MDISKLLRLDLERAETDVARAKLELKYAEHQLEVARENLDTYVLAGDGTDGPQLEDPVDTSGMQEVKATQKHGLADFPSNPDAPDALRGNPDRTTPTATEATLRGPKDPVEFPRPMSHCDCGTCSGD